MALTVLISFPLEAAVTNASTRTIVDVRTAEEFAAGHLEGAVNIPLNATDFHERIKSLDQYSDFILHCGTGARADRVVDIMAEQGFGGQIGSHSLTEALEIGGASVFGDLALANRLNPTRYEDVESLDGPPMCAITGESLFRVTRD